MADQPEEPKKPTSTRGFASMKRDKQKEIATKGGKAAHAKGTAHEWDSAEASAAGRKGGLAVSANREHMARIGRRGGEAHGESRRAERKARMVNKPPVALPDGASPVSAERMENVLEHANTDERLLLATSGN